MQRNGVDTMKKSTTQTKKPAAELRAAYSIAEFCAAYGISPAFYFALKKKGEGPAEMHVGSRRLITKEAAAEWASERIRATVTEALKEYLVKTGAVQ
jgi:hypothetical protein